MENKSSDNLASVLLEGYIRKSRERYGVDPNRPTVERYANGETVSRFYATDEEILRTFAASKSG
jgi:hypothetical protein